MNDRPPSHRALGYALCLGGIWLGTPGGLAWLPGAALGFPAGMALLVLRAPTLGRAVADAFLAGALAWAPALGWVRTPALIHGGAGASLAWLWPVVIGVGKGMYLAILAGLVRLVASRTGPILVGAYAGLGWFLMETGKAAWCKCPLPQYLVGLSQWPWMVQGCSVLGAFGLGGALAACAFWLAAPGRAMAPRLLALAVLVGLGGQALLAMNTHFSDRGAVRLALVQGAAPLVFKWDPAVTNALLDRYAALTEQAVRDTGPDLVVWPETALPTYFLDGIPSTARIRRLARDLRVPLLLGAYGPEQDGGQVAQYNQAVLLGQDGATLGLTEKARLVPFGEYIPPAFQFIPAMVADTGRTRIGRYRAVFPVGQARVGVVICFESLFPDVSSELTGRGANVLLHLSNDAWFAGSAGPEVHLAHARLRAVEQGRYLARCTNTGVTCLIDPRGRVVARAAEDEPLVLDARIGLAKEDTVFQRKGGTAERTALWAFLGLTVWSMYGAFLEIYHARLRGGR